MNPIVAGTHVQLRDLFAWGANDGTPLIVRSNELTKELHMKATILLLGATAMALTPTLASAQTAPGNGQYNGTGYNHTNSGNANGQPGDTCQTLIQEGLGATPGNAGSAPGSGSPFDFTDTNAGAHYAGSQPQNSRNTASVSQYDVACSHQVGH